MRRDDRKKQRDSFCFYPFKALYLGPTGTVQPCPAFASAITKDGRPMSVYEHSVDEIWNSDHMREVRRAMVAGEPVAACEYCYFHERGGLASMRQDSVRQWGMAGPTADQLKAEAEANAYRVDSRPEHLDFSLGNLCNLKCRMCFSSFSSAIAADPVQSRWSVPLYMGAGPWRDAGAVVAPRQVLGVAYENIAEPELGVPTPVAWAGGDAAIRMSLAGVELAGVSIKISGEKPASHPLTISANGRTVFEGSLPPGPWRGKFDLAFLAGAPQLELRLRSKVFARARKGGSAGIGIEEIRLLRSDAGRSAAALSRFAGEGAWFQQKDFLYGELLRDPGRLRTLVMIGGEPLLIKESREIMRHLIDAGAAKNIYLHLVSNGTLVDDEWHELAAQFKHVILGLSVDGYGKVNEYIRFPSQWATLEATLRRWKKLPNTYLCAVATVSAYNMLDLVDLVKFCDEMRVPLHCKFLHKPSHLCSLAMPPAVRKKAAERLRSYAASGRRPDARPMLEKLMSFAFGGPRPEIDPLLKMADCWEAGPKRIDRDLLRQFMIYTNDLDASRGQSFAATFPELRKLIEAAGVPWTADLRFAKPAAAKTK